VARQGLALASAIALGVAACGPATEAKPPPPPPAVAAGAVSFADGAAAARFHSGRFGLSVALPDGKAWRIDDHGKRELWATHAPTHSSLTIYQWNETELMNRAKCETRARELGLDVEGELDVVEQQVASVPDTWDTRIVVLSELRPASKAVLGHVLAYAASIRKCIFFHFQTDARVGEETVVSSRLAVARVTILGGLTMDVFGAVPREPR